MMKLMARMNRQQRRAMTVDVKYRETLSLYRNGTVPGRGFDPRWDEQPAAHGDHDNDEVVLGEEAAHPATQVFGSEGILGVEDAMIEFIEGAPPANCCGLCAACDEQDCRFATDDCGVVIRALSVSASQ